MPMNSRRMVLLAAAFASSIAAAFTVEPEPPDIAKRMFDIRKYGASEASKDNSAAIARAFEAASAAGGGIVGIPAGVYLSGPIRLRSNTALYLHRQAVLRLLPFGEYPQYRGNEFIGAEGTVTNVAVMGRGMIDGQGQPWWPYYKDGSVIRPAIVGLARPQRLLLSGFTITNSPSTNLSIVYAKDVTIRGLRIIAPPSEAGPDNPYPSHNTDACKAGGERLLIADCHFSTGDDNYTTTGYTKDVVITNCFFGEGHGLSIGSYIRGYVKNFYVTDCKFKHCGGIRIKTDRDRGGVVSNLLYSNIVMEDVGTPISIYSTYNADMPYRKPWRFPAATLAQMPRAPVTENTLVLDNIMFKDITATTSEKDAPAGVIFALPESPITRLKMKNVKITAGRPFTVVNSIDHKIVDCEFTGFDGKPLGVDFANAPAE